MPLELLTPDEAPSRDSGLRHNILSPLETLSQSVSAIAPTTSPALTVPLVFALAGNGTWLAYSLACGATLLMALCIARFARTSASPGSLYKYATDSLPTLGGRTAGWALLLAYTAAAVSCVGGFINYAEVLVPALRAVPAPLIAVIPIAAATWFAYRDVQASARLMLIIEATSVSMIALVILALIFRNGPTLDVSQATLHAVTPSGVRLGVILALFSFVGFESATTLGHEARNPLRTIPRAVIQSAILCGFFFLTCCYTEVLGFRQLHQDLGTAQAPFRALSILAHIPIFGPLIDIGAFVSMFACVLACITAASRVLLKMAHDGLAPAPLGRAHSTHETPHIAVLAVALAVLLISLGLTARGVSGMDIYGYMGSLSVYGFITVYFMVAAALPIYLRRRTQLTPAAILLSAAAALAMLLAMAGTLYPIPAAPYNYLPYIYLAYLALGLAISLLIARRRIVFSGRGSH
ncbi:MAG: APC family permease [Acidobacteriaceae bacterium]|jgi:amino acid transporter